jgi:hypothetical protein
MTATIPLKEPLEIVAGDTAKWRVSETDYPPATWTLTYSLVCADARISITATNNGDNTHLVSVAATTTDDWTPGNYYYQAYMTSGAERFMLREGYVEIKPNFATLSAGYDARSHVKKVLDAIEAVIENKATSDQLSYSIAGRSLQRMSWDQIMSAYDDYKRKWEREQAKLRGTRDLETGRKVKGRF